MSGPNADTQAMAALRFIREYQAANGYPPTREELREHLGFESRSSAQRVVNLLVEQGHLVVKSAGGRTTMITEAGAKALTEAV